MDAASGVTVNQLGYLAGGPKAATWVTPGREPVPFRLVDAHGTVLHTGRSEPWPERPEPTSGLTVHVLPFSAWTTPTPAARLRVGDDVSPAFPVATGLYRAPAVAALGVLRALRSGDDVPDAEGGVIAAGHLGVPPTTGDTAVPAWTGPDAERLYPGWRCPGRFDVSGGWYDAGDYGKYVTSGATAVWSLLSTLPLLRAAADDPWAREQRRRLEAEGRWQLDWLRRMQVPAGSPLAGMAFHRVHGTEWSPIPGWAHLDPTTRVLHRPSTPATFQLAAATAHAARLLSDDGPYAARLLRCAETAYAAGRREPGLAAPDDHCRHGGGDYHDDDPSDDAYWAATELWLTTGRPGYLADLRSSPHHVAAPFPGSGFDYDAMATAARLALAGHPDRLPGPDADRLQDQFREAADALVELAAGQPWGQPYAPAEGWAWGSNGRLLNQLVVLLVAHRVTGEPRYADAVLTGMDYLFGRNALGQGYVTGFGVHPPRAPRTRRFARAVDPTYPAVPSGAVVGGANSQPSPDFPYDARLRGLPPQRCYVDDPGSEVTNDLCIRWNAPLVLVTSWLGVVDQNVSWS